MCTTEIGRLALKYDELAAKNVKLATLSADPVSLLCAATNAYAACDGQQRCSCCVDIAVIVISVRGVIFFKVDAAAQVDSHNKWLNDVVAHCENKVTIDFPIIGDADRSIAVK